MKLICKVEMKSSIAFLGLTMIALVALAIVAALMPETRPEKGIARYVVTKRRSGPACLARLR
jgi:hypothetical protein